MSKAIVLAGGSIKGAYQAGAIKAVLDSGFIPDIITGISVGALNGAFLTNEMAKLPLILVGREWLCDWKLAGSHLVTFWQQRIRKPSDIFIKKSAVRIGWEILRKKFNGIVSVEPLRKLVNETIQVENLLKSPVKFSCGFVDINSGKIIYANNQYQPKTFSIEAIMASTAIPITMPLINCSADGGLRDNAPLKQAIEQGATEIIVIATLPEVLDYSNENWGDVMKYADRLMEIIVNNTLNDDLKEAEKINTVCSHFAEHLILPPFIGKRRIKIKVIRPATQIKVALETFNEKDIAAMIEDGYSAAKNCL